MAFLTKFPVKKCPGLLRGISQYEYYLRRLFFAFFFAVFFFAFFFAISFLFFYL